MRRDNLLLFGCDFFSKKKTSELNFWNDMVDCLRNEFERVVVLSVNNRPVVKEKPYDNVFLYNVKPHYLGNTRAWGDPDYSGRRFHNLPLSALYKSYSLLKYLPVFDQLVEQHSVGIIHYMRVFGLRNRVLVRRHPRVIFSITVPTHIDRGFPLHFLYHGIKNRALKPMDKIVTTSRATRERLASLGIAQRKLEMIPWSAGTEMTQAAGRSEEIRNRFRISGQQQVVLWSGPLQDTGFREFSFALDVAREVAACTDRYAFVFAVKPDRLSPEHRTAIPQGDRIRLVETDRSQFLDLSAIADIFLSPVCNKNRTVAPPLTWIEMMQRGIPIITTSVAGADELISHGENGFLVDGVRNTARLLVEVDAARLRKTAAASKRTIEAGYDLRDICRRYVEMWTASLDKKIHSQGALSE